MRWVNKKCKEYLKSIGYDFIYLVPHSRWNLDISVCVGNGLFAKFDGFALRKGEICFFQFKSNQKPQMKPYEAFRKMFGLPAKVIVYYDRKGIREF
jgi:hypothetical protein